MKRGEVQSGMSGPMLTNEARRWCCIDECDVDKRSKVLVLY